MQECGERGGCRALKPLLLLSARVLNCVESRWLEREWRMQAAYIREGLGGEPVKEG